MPEENCHLPGAFDQPQAPVGLGPQQRRDYRAQRDRLPASTLLDLSASNGPAILLIEKFLVSMFSINQRPQMALPEASSPATDAAFVRRCRDCVQDLTTPNIRVYVGDILSSAAIAYSCLVVFLSAWGPLWLQVLCGIVAALSIYRLSIFIHELQHQHADGFLGVRILWNTVCGIPFLMPLFLYDEHRGHHSRATYATPDDAEYLPPRRFHIGRCFVLLALSFFVYPVLGLLRFLIGTPLACCSQRLDRFVFQTLSSLYNLKFGYRRKYDASAVSASRWGQEISASLWSWVLVMGIWQGWIPALIVWKIYLLFGFWMLLNQVRTIAAHRYGGSGIGVVLWQLLDSNTFDCGGLWPEIWAPVGLRYHALHHLMPSMPYHAMRQAHGRLIDALPLDSPYHQTRQPSLSNAILDTFFYRTGRRVGKPL